MKKLTDIELIAEFESGKLSAYEELISRYNEKAYRLAMRITRSQSDSEEVLQDVWISVFEKLDSFEGRSAFSSWLFRIVYNTSLMKLRQRKKHTAIELDDSVISKQSGWMFHRSDTCDTAFLTIRHELREKLSKAINGLQKEYRTIFILRDVDKYSNQEVSDILDISVAAVKSRLHRARNILRNHLSEFYNHPNNSIHLNEKDFKQSASSCLREKEVNGVTQV